MDEWPEKYPSVHVLENQGGGLAPWNVNQYRYTFDNDGIELRHNNSGSTSRLVFYHFHFVRFQGDNKIDIGWHYIPKKIKEKLYFPYIQSLIRIESQLSKKYNDYKPEYYTNSPVGVKNLMKWGIKTIAKYNLLSTDKI
jgi:hypothetical protein